MTRALRPSVATALLLAAVALGCQPAGPDGFGSSSVEPNASAGEVEAKVDPRAIALGDLHLGWDAIPRLPKANAVADNRAGIDALEAGDAQAALEAFERALEEDADYGWARFGRARALAVLERPSEAFAEIAVLLQADLPRFGPAIRADEGLALIREGPERELLETLHSRVEESYATAARNGALGWVYTPRGALSPRTQQAHAPYENLRAVAFVGDRVVPLSPDHPLALGAVLDDEAGRLMVVSGEIVVGDMWVVQPRKLGVHLYDLDHLGQAIFSRSRIDSREEVTQLPRNAVVAAIEGDAVRLGYRNLAYIPSELTVDLNAKRAKIVAQTRDDSELGSQALIDEQERLLARHVQPDQVHVVIDGHGVRVHQPLPGVVIGRGRLQIDGRGGAIVLDGAHDLAGASVRLERSVDGEVLMVLSQLARCGGAGITRRYALSRVELGSGEVTLLASGEGFAGASMDGGGTIYLETPEIVGQVVLGEARVREDLPERLHFALPGFAYDCGV